MSGRGSGQGLHPGPPAFPGLGASSLLQLGLSASLPSLSPRIGLGSSFPTAYSPTAPLPQAFAPARLPTGQPCRSFEHSGSVQRLHRSCWPGRALAFLSAKWDAAPCPVFLAGWLGDLVADEGVVSSAASASRKAPLTWLVLTIRYYPKVTHELNPHFLVICCNNSDGSESLYLSNNGPSNLQRRKLNSGRPSPWSQSQPVSCLAAKWSTRVCGPGLSSHTERCSPPTADLSPAHSSLFPG